MPEQKVESGRIATGAVTGDNIAVNAIRANNIVDGTITSAKLHDPAGGFEDLFLMGGL